MNPVLLASALAFGAPPPVYHLDLPLELDCATSWDACELALEDAVGLVPPGYQPEVWAWAPDGMRRPLREVESLLPRVPVPLKDPPLRGAPVDHVGAVDGALTGKAVYMSQCHGWLWEENLDDWATQRGNLFGGVEDFMNPEGANQYLLRWLENAGARVFTARERDMNPNMVIVDNADPDYDESGAGFSNGNAGFATLDAAGLSTWTYGKNPFALGGTRKFPADGGAVATWTVSASAAGNYAVYVSWDSDAGNASDAHYRITHAGGSFDRTFDQRVHGSTWQYVDTVWVPAGGEVTVELIADSAQSGRTLSADAVRLGGGQSDVSRAGQLPGRSRWEEGSIYYAQFNGAPSSIYDPYGDGDGSDPTVRSKWAQWEHPSGEDAVYLSWHSNAANGTARGTSTYFAGGGDDAPSGYGAQCSSDAVNGSYTLARFVQDEMVDSFRDQHESTWQDRNVLTSCFAEVNPSNNAEIPSILVELAFHDTEADSDFLRDPVFRRDAARAMYRGIVKYFADKDNVDPVFVPEAPIEPALVHDEDGFLELTWADGEVGDPFGDGADSWVVETSPDGRAWGPAFSVNQRRTRIDADFDETIYARVSAVNDGGRSFPSSVVGARRSPDGHAAVLVVDGFDRLDRGMLVNEYVSARLGTLQRMYLENMNPQDVVVAHGQAIASVGWPFESAHSSRIGDLDLDQEVIWWASGEESTADETLSIDEQAVIDDYLDAGGKLAISGSEILWDLVDLGTNADKAFVERLDVGYANDDADSEAVEGEGEFAGIDASFAWDDGALYPVEYPDELEARGDVVLRYDNGGVAATITEAGAFFGFPFETIVDARDQRQIAAALLPALAPRYTPPTAPEDPTDEEQPTETDAPTDPEVTDGPGDPTDDEVTDAPGGGGALFAERKAKSTLGGCDAAGGGLGSLGLIVAATALRRRRR
jgi:hypothetical protein